MARQALTTLFFLLLPLISLSACGKKQEVTQDLRALKTITVSAPATGQVRNFSGTVSASNSASLSFEVAGKVEVVNVEIGDEVKKGQILAVLDEEPYKLDLTAAEAEVTEANARIVDKKAEYERQERVYRQGAGAKGKLDAAKYDYEAAKSGVDFQMAKLNIAKRSLRKTELQAPYDGSVARRMVEPGEEVKVGQPVFDLDGAGALEVVIAVPETTIARINLGTKVNLTFPTMPGQVYEGRISYIGSAAVKSNAFPVKVALVNAPVEISPGMTAEASLILKAGATPEIQNKGYLIPVQALLPATEPRTAFIFVYDSETSVVRKKQIQTKGEQHNMAIVDEGVSAGDIIAVAGVSFLADGMKVKLMKQ